MGSASITHFFLPPLRRGLALAEHIHTPRLEAVTDHSALLVELGEYAAGLGRVGSGVVGLRDGDSEGPGLRPESETGGKIVE